MQLPDDNVIWRLLSLLMGGLFLIAGINQMGTDYPCVWVPVYTVPAALCFLVAVRIQFAGYLPWRACYLVHTSCSLALLVLVLVRTLRALHRTTSAAQQQPSGALVDQQLIGNGRDMAALVITLVWMKMTKYVSDSHVRVVLSRQQTSWLLPLLLLLALTVPGLLWLAC